MYVRMRWILLLAVAAVAVTLVRCCVFAFCHRSCYGLGLLFGFVRRCTCVRFSLGVYRAVAKARLKSNKPECDVFSITLYSDAFSSQYFFVVCARSRPIVGRFGLFRQENFCFQSILE